MAPRTRAVISTWLGASLDSLSKAELARFTAAWDRIHETYPQESDSQAREVALTAALEYLSGEMTPAKIGIKVRQMKAQRAQVNAAAKEIAILAHEDGVAETDLARAIGVDRGNTIRRWIHH